MSECKDVSSLVWHGSQDSCEAEPLFRESLDGRREVLGVQHPDTLTSCSNLAVLLPDTYSTELARGCCNRLWMHAAQACDESAAGGTYGTLEGLCQLGFLGGGRANERRSRRSS